MVKALLLLPIQATPGPPPAGLDTTTAVPADVAPILDRAIAFQRGSAAAIPTGAFHGRFSVAVRKPDGGFLEAEVERHYVREPERMLTRRIDGLAHSDTSVGFDGSAVWFRDNVQGDLRIYSDDPETFETDLLAESRQLRLMRLVHDALALDVLLGRLESPRLLGRLPIQPPGASYRGQDTQADVLLARLPDEVFPPDPDLPPPLPDEPEPRLEVRLSIDARSGALLKVDLRPLETSVERSLEFWFMNHGANSQGLQGPRTLVVFEDGLESLRLGLADEQGLASFTLGGRMDDGMFRAPESTPPGPAREPPPTDG